MNNETIVGFSFDMTSRIMQINLGRCYPLRQNTFLDVHHQVKLSLIQCLLSIYVTMQVWLRYLPGQGYEQKSLDAEKMAKGTHFDISTSLLNTTFK